MQSLRSRWVASCKIKLAGILAMRASLHRCLLICTGEARSSTFYLDTTPDTQARSLSLGAGRHSQEECVRTRGGAQAERQRAVQAGRI